MSYLLDTNVLIFSLCSPNKLSRVARRIVTAEPAVCVSIVSLWEIAIKQGLGKLNVNLTIPQIEQICIARNIKILPITAGELEGINRLPSIHKDPFDRLIVSQARANNLSLVTSDQTIPKYDVKTVW